MLESELLFDVVLFTPTASTPILVRSALTADAATVVFATEMQHLQMRRTQGDLAIRRRDAGSACVLRQPIPQPDPLRRR